MGGRLESFMQCTAFILVLVLLVVLLRVASRAMHSSRGARSLLLPICAQCRQREWRAAWSDCENAMESFVVCEVSMARAIPTLARARRTCRGPVGPQHCSFSIPSAARRQCFGPEFGINWQVAQRDAPRQGAVRFGLNGRIIGMVKVQG
jgi:hypothetical protein